ncbi:hypothetical protein L228DRAFT_243260 [Xylona heveae TC161]|uniref:Uncharacterized protein n=1 Tax=Xylona heveae (strain CBS 132557 / TC161) TaxID=1328760 RepID=A0A165JXG9_XYLHT|nr:hypothetical protein L228DRAFT_243260 [Xylona heveae TC161]KZF26747.1 hypothetical protein L228DRAFT_243260 [Xylona heveae TC161]
MNGLRRDEDQLVDLITEFSREFEKRECSAALVACCVLWTGRARFLPTVPVAVGFGARRAEVSCGWKLVGRRM